MALGGWLGIHCYRITYLSLTLERTSCVGNVNRLQEVRSRIIIGHGTIWFALSDLLPVTEH
ncbi:hypothetical protein F2Q69_00001113 [Brassica cretica]|uniref:Uncharacterized protein n=1 Tax=Brassica cretica TaxID=69181 RepID=A0A8S9PCG9_BRACR|nr:hypothetical protein F2Q69_00001113 [Brassica cretica]